MQLWCTFPGMVIQKKYLLFLRQRSGYYWPPWDMPFHQWNRWLHWKTSCKYEGGRCKRLNLIKHSPLKVFSYFCRRVSCLKASAKSTHFLYTSVHEKERFSFSVNAVYLSNECKKSLNMDSETVEVEVCPQNKGNAVDVKNQVTD